MALLHTVNKSPFDKNSLSDCLRRATSGSTVLLIEDGVYGALSGSAHAPWVVEALGDGAGYLQPLKHADLGIVARNSTEAAPQGSIIRALSGTVGQEFAVSASQDHRPIRRKTILLPLAAGPGCSQHRPMRRP